MGSRTKFIQGEKVLCFHGEVLYDARIKEVKKKGRTQVYFVHYLGWSPK
jgi:mortality factor 4-like protein 1